MAGWNFLSSMADIFKSQGVAILINLFFGTFVNAAQAIAQQVNNAVNQFCNNFMTAITPQITKSYAQGDIKRSISLTFASAKAQGYLVLVMMIPFLLESHYILTIWLKSFPVYTQEFVCWGILISFIHAITGAFGPIYLAMGRIRNLQLAGSLLNFMYLPVCYLCCERGINVIICMQLGFGLEILLFFMSYFYLKKVMSFPFWHFLGRVVMPMLLVGIITLCAVYCVRIVLKDESFTRLILSTVTSFVIFSISAYFIGIDDSERKIVRAAWVKRFGKYRNNINNFTV